MNRLNELTATEIVQAIVAGKTNCEAVVRACLDRITEREPHVFMWEIDNHWERLSEMLRSGRLKDGLSCSFEHYRQARDLAERCRTMLGDVFGDRDLILVPAASGEAPIGLNSTGNASFCAIWTTVHVPAVTLPLFKGPNGLPVGAQFVARRNADRKLMAACKWVIQHAG